MSELSPEDQARIDTTERRMLNLIREATELLGQIHEMVEEVAQRAK